MEVLDEIIDLNILTQDEYSMVKLVQSSFFDNSLAIKKIRHEIAQIEHNIKNVQILCEGDSILEKDLTEQMAKSTQTLQYFQERILPKDVLIKQLEEIKKKIESRSAQHNQKDNQLHSLRRDIKDLEANLARVQNEVQKDEDSVEFKTEICKHLKKNLESRIQKITKHQQTKNLLQNKIDKANLVYSAGTAKRQEDLDNLRTTALNFKQKLAELEEKFESETKRLKEISNEWESKILKMEEKNHETEDIISKGDIEKKYFMGHIRSYLEKYNFVKNQSEKVALELENAINEIANTEAKITEYSSIPETHLNTVKLLETENTQLQQEIDHLGRDQKEANEHIKKLEREFAILDKLDSLERRQKMENEQRSLRECLERIDHAIMAAQSSFTCFECLKNLKSPMTFVPCGHSICRHHGKHSDDMLICPECTKQADTVFANQKIPELLSKLQFLHSLITSAVET